MYANNEEINIEDVTLVDSEPDEVEPKPVVEDEVIEVTDETRYMLYDEN